MAVPNSDVAVEALEHVVKGVKQEIVVESGLRVSALAAMSCQQKFGSVGAVAPPLEQPARGPVPTDVNEQEMELAVCLLTPTEQAPEANDIRIRQAINNLMERAEIEAAACDLVEREKSTLKTKVRSPRCTKGRRKGKDTEESADDLMGNIIPCILGAVCSSVTSSSGLGGRK
ncbi:hypothetical protein BSKO_12445 [Bryopsis sp. KO-2023]|nr:hypothetical protein BSKO_12445 [Bryopsis sp. KO-2023]